MAKIPYEPLFDREYRGIGCEVRTVRTSKEGTENSVRDQDLQEIMARVGSWGY